MRIVFISWRDLAHPQAGGSEFVVDRLASFLTGRGHDVALLAAGPIAPRDYAVIDTGGTYSQYARAPFHYWRRCRGADVVVDVENGVPFFSPVWQCSPVVCLVHHVHTEQWALYYPRPVAEFGRFVECRAMPRLYRNAVFVAVSPSTAHQLRRIGVEESRVHTIIMGSQETAALRGEAAEPTFLALGRLVPHKRIDLLLEMWERVRPHVGGTLILAGEGPERERLEARAGEGVVFTGFVSTERKRDLLDRAWLLLHSALHEGWGTVIMEAAAASTPTIGFNVVGVRDSVQHRRTGLLASDVDAFVSAWIELATTRDRRVRLGLGARDWAASNTWARATEQFEVVLEGAAASTIPRARRHARRNL
jgi:glycosyltransferase involved in cell wall biosynthesis